MIAVSFSDTSPRSTSLRAAELEAACHVTRARANGAAAIVRMIAGDDCWASRGELLKTMPRDCR